MYPGWKRGTSDIPFPLYVHAQSKYNLFDKYLILISFFLQEFDGKLCIVCPKHKYKISLAEGEGIYRATNPYAPVPTTRWYSKGIKQRVHTVTETDGDVYVTLSHMSRFIESDYFQGEKGKVERERMEAEDYSKKSNTTS